MPSIFNSYFFDDSGQVAPLTLIRTPTIDPIVEENGTTTSVKIRVDTINLNQEPTSYVIGVIKKIQNELGVWVPDGNTPVRNLTFSPADEPFTVTGLVSGGVYTFSITAYLNENPGNTVYRYDYPIPVNGVPIQTLSDNPTNFKPSKSYLTISATEIDFKNKRFGVAYREFPAITVVPPTTTSTKNGNTYGNAGYYSFGTSILMDNSLDNTNQSGGFGFFIDNGGQTGYYIILETTASIGSIDKKSVTIKKFIDNKQILLKEIGTRTESTIEGIYGGRIYNIDVKVKVLGQSTYIEASVNGYKINYIDTTYRDKSNAKTAFPFTETQILAPTNKVSLLCQRGTVSFDYAFGRSITGKQYENSTVDLNFYRGQFSNDLINTSFGDLAYISEYKADDVTAIQDTGIDEFGTVVREIYQRDIKFDSRPGYPIKWSTGVNPYAKVIGQKVSNFGSKVFVLNNTSTTIPLSNGSEASLFIYGNSLGSSGELVYTTESANTFNTKEPVTFQSTWLQNESDVKSLANWIKGHVVNKGKIVEMSIFGNPLISIGDIVSISYSYQGITENQNFIVTSVKQSFSQGLETSIICRVL
jgi:hypothetical protein